MPSVEQSTTVQRKFFWVAHGEVLSIWMLRDSATGQGTMKLSLTAPRNFRRSVGCTSFANHQPLTAKTQTRSN
jgi:hypothetical protein